MDGGFAGIASSSLELSEFVLFGVVMLERIGVKLYVSGGRGDGKDLSELRLIITEGNESKVRLGSDRNDGQNGLLSGSAGLERSGLLSISVNENSELGGELSIDGME